MNVIHLTRCHSADLLKKKKKCSWLDLRPFGKVTVLSYEFSLCARVCTAVCVCYNDSVRDVQGLRAMFSVP